MSTISTHYGQWISQFNWSHIATIRLLYKLTETSAQRLGQRIISSPIEISRLFYSVEKDSYDNMNHMHLLLESTAHTLSRKDVAQAAGLSRNPKAISFIQEVDSKKAVSSWGMALNIFSRLNFSLLTNIVTASSIISSSWGTLQSTDNLKSKNSKILFALSKAKRERTAAKFPLVGFACISQNILWYFIGHRKS